MAQSAYSGLLTQVLVSMSDRIMGNNGDSDTEVPSFAPPEPVAAPPEPIPGDLMDPATDPATAPTTSRPRRKTGPPGAPVPTGKGKMNLVEVARLARNAGFSGDALVTAVAIAVGESGLNPGAMGDTTITDAKWGPSVGLMQIRSFNNERGKGSTRDERANLDPATNLVNAFTISGGGKSFTPWSVYKNGTYKKYLGDARAAVAALGGD